MSGIVRQPAADGSSLAVAIRELQEWANEYGPGPTWRAHMAERLATLERRFEQTDSPELSYWLGVATRCYVLWHVRSYARKQHLERAVEHLERALDCAACLPEYAPDAPLDRATIAASLGMLLVDEEVIRDLDRGIAYLETLFHTAPRYELALCCYANGLYKRGDYQQAAEVALELHKRALCAPEWHGSAPQAPLEIAAKAYRALARVHKKRGENTQAIAALKKLVELDDVTENDRTLIEQIHASPLIAALLARTTTVRADYAIIT